jgi:hypothetical protein
MAHWAPLHAAPVQLVPCRHGPASDEHPEQLDMSYRQAFVQANPPASPLANPSVAHVAAGVSTPSHDSVSSLTPFPHTGQPPSGHPVGAVSVAASATAVSATDVSMTDASTAATRPPAPDDPPRVEGGVAPSLPPSEPPAAGGCEPDAPPAPNEAPPVCECEPVPAACTPPAPPWPAPDLEIAVKSSPFAHARTDTLTTTNPYRTIFMANLGPSIGCPEGRCRSRRT